MRSAISPLFLSSIFASWALLRAADGGPQSLAGFATESTKAQLAVEQRFDAQLRADDQKEWMEQMASAPNHVGSPHDKVNAEFLLAKYKEWGWDARVEEFEVLYPTPKKTVVELVAPQKFAAKLQEPAVAGDRTSTQVADELPPYHAFAADGDVTAELVYVNQGMPDDYKELAQNGIDVKGRIVIVRYGGGWRGLKPKFAYEHGAVGCIIYSDPRDDGYGAGDAYPKGAFRPADGVQRGSVLDMPVYPGDPLTPDVGATKEAKRLAIKDARTILKIPVLPISHADALPLLAALDGEVVPEKWRGALPITYHFGPGPAKVHLSVQSEWTLKTARDVIAVMKGSEHPDEWVLRGNHFDGWVFGASDPLSGQVALMAEAKAIGALARDGWRPKRTLVYCSWDAEEPGLLGSTEWAEAHAAELQQKAVLYLNSDGNERGFLHASGSHALQTLVNQAADSVIDPQTKATVLKRQRAKLIVGATASDTSEEMKRIGKLVAAGGTPPLGALGAGSDYTAFIDHLGIASLNIGFGGEGDTGGVYHSAYDSFDHFTRFGDPGFAYGVALSQTAGRVMLRMANADVLPHMTDSFHETVAQYATELHKLADTMRENTEQMHRVLDEKLHALAADPTKTSRPPEREAAVPVLNFAPLDNALLRLKKSTRTFDDAMTTAQKTGLKFDAAKRTGINATLRALEQTLLDPAGLPGRDWFRHMIYAPGLKTGYGAKTLPGIREAIEDRRWQDAEKFSVAVANALGRYCDALDNAGAALKSRN
ncbi:MAG: M28 family peptidase [Verrucomicrobiaceae bacterium]|nr:M28 family peptidase [Verrucomicrobiaceae bacterium]